MRSSTGLLRRWRTLGLPGLSRIDLYADRVVITGTRSERVIPLATIHDVEPGTWGLVFRRHLFGVSSGPGLLGDPEIAAAIMEQVRAWRAAHPDERSRLEKVVDDLAEMLELSGHAAEAAWLEARKDRWWELRPAATGEVLGLRDLYLGGHTTLFYESLDRLVELTDESR